MQDRLRHHACEGHGIKEDFTRECVTLFSLVWLPYGCQEVRGALCKQEGWLGLLSCRQSGVMETEITRCGQVVGLKMEAEEESSHG